MSAQLSEQLSEDVVAGIEVLSMALQDIPHNLLAGHLSNMKLDVTALMRSATFYAHAGVVCMPNCQTHLATGI